MSTSLCPECKYEGLTNGSDLCPNCGSNWSKAENDDFNFAASQHNSVEMDLGDDYPEAEQADRSTDDQASITDPVPLFDQPAGSSSDFENDSTTIIADQSCIDTGETRTSAMSTGSSDADSVKGDYSGTRDSLKKLSEDEIKDIETNFYGDRKSSKKTEPDITIKSVSSGDTNNRPFDSEPIVPPKRKQTAKSKIEDVPTDLPQPKMASRGKGIAYFYKNYIKLVGLQELHLDDEMTVAGRLYTLKPKRFNQTVVLSLASVTFALLLVAIGSMFISKNDLISAGNLAGIILDENDQPFIQGVDIFLPELGMKVKSNAEGFFKTGPLDAGTYKLIYSYKGSELGTEYVTVTSSKISMLALRPSSFEEDIPVQTKYSSEKPQQLSVVEEISPKQPQSKSKTKKKSSSRKPKKKKKKRQPKATFASLALQTNIQNAEISIDGQTVGVGNLTYDRLKPGEHRYRISSDGYESVSGIVYLADATTTALSVELTRSEAPTKSKTNAQNNYHLGMQSVKNHQYEKAFSQFTQVIDEQPDHAGAYQARGDIYAMNKNWRDAHNDYFRAGTILNGNGNHGSAITAYTKAIEANKKSVPAYIHRGDCFLATNEPRAAVMDYEAALKYDKRNPDAYFGLGLARFQQGSFKKAIKHFGDARSLDPNNPDVYEYLILCYSSVQDEKNLRKTFEQYAQIASEEDLEEMRTDSKFDEIWSVLGNE